MNRDTVQVQIGSLDSLLTEIPDPPQSLYIRGSLPSPHTTKLLAVVGSRKYSPYGRAVCERLIDGLSGYPVCIVSGLALGIDGIAHRAALHARLVTVAVPGSGIDPSVLYPAAHRGLAREILEQNGALVSEFPPRTRARPEYFPRRNRIMAGLCHAVLVIEATPRSGTLITARLAGEYNRDVLAVPGPIHMETTHGPHMLIKNGAALIETSDDILAALDLPRHECAAPEHFDLSPDETRVITQLRNAPLSRDELIRTSGMEVSALNVTLASLELRGAVQEVCGKLTIR